MHLIDKSTECPHCGHHIHITLDDSNGDQDYYEDCPACCNSIHISFHLDERDNHVDVILEADD
ncbi:CPXCG motif-containing cysteine-rich protein [Catenovulum adriaticum]|uniref:CPXCG motif-containing cysteine-rich protein n=1 Tax=Catenovulum adriaticum TaxID=2984846 RepID=A0ABY7AIH8_9ALTE|nr:CPXCG motif-containing cysteine-rich protein [Catenovulum sp. TS8]WAJ69008.1 CPXCG motif-containing cysteine-rich protein [Catenovulum sp. TS8]